MQRKPPTRRTPGRKSGPAPRHGAPPAFPNAALGPWRRLAYSGGWEVVLVAAVLLGLGVLAYPSFLAYDTRAHRAAAQAFMLEVANAQVGYQAVHRRYATGPGALAALGYADVPAEVADHYTVVIEPLRGPPPGFHILATPEGMQAQRDAACATLSLTHTGARAVSGTALDCWGQ